MKSNSFFKSNSFGSFFSVHKQKRFKFKTLRLKKTLKLKTFRPSSSSIEFTVKPKRLLSNKLKNACDQKRRTGVLNSELERQLHKSLLAYLSNTPDESFILNHRLSKRMPRTTITRIRNRCVLTGDPQTIGNLGVSPITFRRLANLGLIPGLSKV